MYVDVVFVITCAFEISRATLMTPILSELKVGAWQDCFSFSRSSSDYFDLRTLDGTKIHASAGHKQVQMLQRVQPCSSKGGFLPLLKRGEEYR